MDFSAAVQDAQIPYKKVHALLGNGFSRACRDDIFAYGALFDRADFSALSGSARSAFDALATRDFEVAIHALRQSTRLLSLYVDDIDVASRMQSDADGLRDCSYPRSPVVILTTRMRLATSNTPPVARF